MKTMKGVYLALFGALLLVAGSVSVWAQAAQQTGDQTKSDSSTATKGKKKKKAASDASPSQAAPDAGTASSKEKSTSKKADTSDKSATADSPTAPKKSRSKQSTASTAPASAPASKSAISQQAPPANSAGMVWVNLDSGVYHKPGTRWYGKTKQGKYMTEADAIKAGYHAAKKE